MSGERSRTPSIHPRDVWTVVWVLLVTAAGLFVLYQIRQFLIWLLVAVFLAAVVSPLVSFLVARGVRRSLAVVVVLVALLVAVGGLTYLFVRPVVDQAVAFAQDLPGTIDRLRDAPVVRQLLERFEVETRVEEVSSDLPGRLVGLSGPLLQVFATIGELIVGTITILVLTVFLLLYGPQFVDNGLDLIDDPMRRARAERIGAQSLHAVSGWVAGNVLTSIVAALASVLLFVVVGLPYAALLGLWVGVADLIPLIGATLGAIPAVLVAFLHSTTAGIVVLVFFVVYQQFENHVLQPAVYGRTIKLNPFLVLVAVIAGVELAGFLGAMLALPVAGVIQIVLVDVMEHRRERRVVGEALSHPSAQDLPARQGEPS